MRLTESDKQYAVELKLLRKKNYIKQQTMAEHLELETQQQYSDLETGKKHFTDKLILKICSFFNISILQFTGSKLLSPETEILDKEVLIDIERFNNNETLMLYYKKLFLESKLETTEIKLNLLNNKPNHLKTTRHKIHVII